MISRSPNEQASNVSAFLRFDGAQVQSMVYGKPGGTPDQTLHSKLCTLQDMHVKETTQQSAARTMSWNEPDRLHGSTQWQTWMRLRICGGLVGEEGIHSCSVPLRALRECYGNWAFECCIELRERLGAQATRGEGEQRSCCPILRQGDGRAHWSIRPSEQEWPHVEVSS